MDVVLPLASVAGTRLRVLCAEHGWLFDDRIKSIESCLSKLEAGSAELASLHDLYGAMVIVPTQNELDPACEAILQSFSGELKTRSIPADTFVYDDIHVLAKLEGKVSPRSVPFAQVLEREFEIQVRTGMQYAWWRATHEAMYKSSDESSHTWEMKRAAGQARASLELLDGLLSDLPAAATLQRPRASDTDEMKPKRLLQSWSPAARPEDVFRFCLSVNRLLRATSFDLDKLEQILSEAGFAEVIRSRDVTPFQAVTIALERALGSADLSSSLITAGFSVLVTPEMIAVEPDLERLDPMAVARA